MNVILPASMAELWYILENEPHPALCAGGTDIMVKVRAGTAKADTLVCLESLQGLKGIRDDGDAIFIGACTTHTDILGNEIVRTAVPILTKAVHVLGSPPIRNMATIGGNICTASPAGDTLPPLYALDAEVALWSRRGKRRIPIDQFVLGPGKTALRNGEIVEGVGIKKPESRSICHFEKVGQRKAMSISIASLAAVIRTERSGAIERISLAWGSVGPTVARSKEIERTLIGKRLDARALKKVAPLVDKTISPISDVRAGADYRRAVSANLLLRLAQYGATP